MLVSVVNDLYTSSLFPGSHRLFLIHASLCCVFTQTLFFSPRPSDMRVLAGLFCFVLSVTAVFQNSSPWEQALSRVPQQIARIQQFMSSAPESRQPGLIQSLASLQYLLEHGTFSHDSKRTVPSGYCTVFGDCAFFGDIIYDVSVVEVPFCCDFYVAVTSPVIPLELGQGYTLRITSGCENFCAGAEV